MGDEAEIIVEPYKRIVIHEIVENRFSDLVALIVSGTRAAGGTTIPMLNWCNGVVFQIVPFNPHSEGIIAEQLKGIVHYAAITFATKERFEPEVRLPDGTIRLIDQRANPNFVKLAEVLKSRAKYQA